jgi:hypothetical protein
MKKAGRPRTWVLNDEIVEIHRLSTKLQEQNPETSLVDIKSLLKAQLEQEGRTDFVQKFNRLWTLMMHVIPLPPTCICGETSYSYTHRKVDSDREHYWEIFARCTNKNCRYMRRYLPGASYKWSRLSSIKKQLEQIPTFYELDGQKVEQ